MLHWLGFNGRHRHLVKKQQRCIKQGHRASKAGSLMVQLMFFFSELSLTDNELIIVGHTGCTGSPRIKELVIDTYSFSIGILFRKINKNN